MCQHTFLDFPQFSRRMLFFSSGLHSVLSFKFNPSGICYFTNKMGLILIILFMHKHYAAILDSYFVPNSLSSNSFATRNENKWGVLGVLWCPLCQLTFLKTDGLNASKSSYFSLSCFTRLVN